MGGNRRQQRSETAPQRECRAGEQRTRREPYSALVALESAEPSGASSSILTE